jgi:hypothetical protein
MRKVRAGSRLCASALEIHDCENLEVLAAPPPWQEAQAFGWLLRREHQPEVIDLSERIGSVVVLEAGGHWPLALV